MPSQHSRFSELDNSPVQDSDGGFKGFASGNAPDTLPEGIAAFMQNIRTTDNNACTRPANKLLKDGDIQECEPLVLSFALGCEFAASSLTRVGSTATFVSTTPLDFVTGTKVAVECADQSEYNIDAIATVTAPDTFTYTIVGTPATPATGSPIVTSGPILGAGTSEGVRAKIEWRDPLTLETRILRALTNEAQLIDPNEPGSCVSIPYPPGEAVCTDEPAWLTQVNDRVILHRGFQQQALEWFNDETVAFVLKPETGSVKWNMPRSSWSVWYQNRLIVPLQAIPVEITSLTRVGLTATMITLKPHGMPKGESILITGGNGFGWAGEFTITAVPTTTTIEFVLDAAPPTTDAGGGAEAFVRRFDEFIVSDILDTDTFDPINARFRFNAGGADNLVFVYPWLDDQLIVLMRYSVHLVKGINDIDNAEKFEISREVGCSSMGSVAGGGPFVFFRQDNNIYRIVAGEELKLQWLKDAISHPDIDDIMQTVTVQSSHEDRSVYFNNRYWLALPFDGSTRNTKILVYNIVNQLFESVDTFFVDHKIDFMCVARFNGKRQRFGSNQEGALWVFDVLDDEEAEDEIGPLTPLPVPTRPIDFALDTRLYTASSREIKRWENVQTSMVMTTLQTMAKTPRLEDPDALGETRNFVGTTTKDPLKRLRIARRGRGLQIQYRSSIGRPKVRNTIVVGSVGERDIQQFD